MSAAVLTPTAQQQAILDAAATGDDVKIIAGAGAGKSSTLRLIAKDMEVRGQTGTYIAFNKAVAAEAKASFPRNVQATTAHSLAYRAVQQTPAGPALLAKLKARKVPLSVTVKRMNITGAVITTNDGQRRLSAYDVARVAADTVKLFCQSADRFITRTHLPVVVGFGDGTVRGDGHDDLATHIGPIARRMWADIINPKGDSTQFSHDAYLKLWSMSDPVLPGHGVLLIDEAQDLNPAVAVVVARQRVDGDPHRKLQRIVVGDNYQAIYGFNGSRDYLRTFQAPHVLELTKSWRFGPAVADAANRILAKLHAGLRIEGNDAVTSQIVPGYTEPTDGSTVGAILCRTNAGAVAEAIQASARGHRVFLRAGKAEIASFIDSAEALRQGGLPKHPDLQVFGSWAEVVEYVELDPNGGDLKVRVKLVEDYGIPVLRQALARCVDDETQATCVASTAHTMKGLEYPWVIISADFDRGDDDDRPPSDEELMLAYVSVTRAKNILDPGGLSRLLGFEKPVAAPAVVAAAAGPGRDEPDPAPPSPAAPLVVTIKGDLADQLRDLFGDEVEGHTITLIGAALSSALRQVTTERAPARQVR